jgi:hypothetical protein
MDMGCQRHPHFGIFYIRDAEILAGLFDDLADSRVVYVGDPREKMVFYLEIQSAHPPGNKPVAGGKLAVVFNW